MWFFTFGKLIFSFNNKHQSKSKQNRFPVSVSVCTTTHSTLLQCTKYQINNLESTISVAPYKILFYVFRLKCKQEEIFNKVIVVPLLLLLLFPFSFFFFGDERHLTNRIVSGFYTTVNVIKYRIVGAFTAGSNLNKHRVCCPFFI